MEENHFPRNKICRSTDLTTEFNRTPEPSEGHSPPKHPNGTDDTITFGQVWRHYEVDHLPTLSESARALKVYRCQRFLPPLFPIKMTEMAPQLIFEVLRFTRKKGIHPQKCNFDKELNDLKSIFNWYSDTIDFHFRNPVKPAHFKAAVIKAVTKKEKQIPLENLRRFFDALPPFYRDIAMMQFFCGARIGEIAGLQAKNIDLENRVLKIQEVLVWIRGKPVIKPHPKNGAGREVFLSDTMLEILQRHLSVRPSDCPLVFEHEGRPLLYATICLNFNNAWKRAGLPHFSGTHLMRYAAAQISRKISGSIESARSVTGHRSLALAEKYSAFTDLSENRVSVEILERALMPFKAAA